MNETFKTYLFTYEHDGASWVLEVKASDPDDAERRIRRIQYATYDGELIVKITPTLIGSITCKIKDLIRRLPLSGQN